MTNSLLAAMITGVVLITPAIIEACPQCFVTADNQVLYAYYFSALFMILVPIGIIGSILAWLFIQNRQAEDLEAKQEAPNFEAGSRPSQEVPA